MFLLLTIVFTNHTTAQAISTKNQQTEATQIYQIAKSINSSMKGVSLVPRANATAEDKELLKLFKEGGMLSIKVERAGSHSDLGKGQLQLALQESNNSIKKLVKTGKLTILPGGCYNQCDDQTGFGAAWNRFFCVFKCFKAATVNFD